MLLVFATLRRRSSRMAFAYFALSLLLVGVFLATPLGAQRIASESNTSLSNNHGHETNGTSLGWRFYKWGLLISEWEEAPVLGHGLGATVTAEGNAENVTAGKVPHNEYLRYLVETGALGISLAVFGVLALLRALWRRRSTAHLEALLALSVFVGCLVNALADNTFLYTTTAYAAALIIAAALAAVPRVEATAAPLRHAPAPL
jgi:O-antigen ligase